MAAQNISESVKVISVKESCGAMKERKKEEGGSKTELLEETKCLENSH